MTRPWTIGVARQGVVEKRLTYRTRPDLCPGMGHPGVTYNPLCDRTWCLCGAVVYEGEAPTVRDYLACCGGPLTEEVWA